MRSKKWIIIFFVIVIALAIARFFQIKRSTENEIEFVENMGAGWNLGNSLDSHGIGKGQKDLAVYETYWGNPVTTKEMIHEVKEQGFQTLRIPVTWYEHMDESGNIDKEWMDRVQEVVDYGIEEDMYVIIDCHHDAWFYPGKENLENAVGMLEHVWEQIAERFQDYDERLLFEGMNEPRLIGEKEEWTSGTKEAREIINELNQVFVDTVRDSGGKNKERYLMIPTYCNRGSKEAAEDLKIPEGGHIIVSIHEYIPYEFALNPEGTDSWNAGNREDTAELEEIAETLDKNFIQKGIPVIFSEFGAIDKNNEKARAEWSEYYVNLARKYHIGYIWWDDGGNDTQKGFRLFDRYRQVWLYPELVEVLVKPEKQQ